MDVKDAEEYKVTEAEGFVKDKRWVIFPRLSYQAHINIEARNVELSKEFSSYKRNMIIPAGADMNQKKGIATGGFNFNYVNDAMTQLGQVRELRIATPHPFPEELAVQFLTGLLLSVSLFIFAVNTI